MNTKLYDLTKKFYTAKLWNKLNMTEIFAIPLTDGRTGYVSVHGKEDDLKGIELFVGQDGIDSCRAAISRRYPDFGDAMLHLKGLSIVFCSKEELPQEAYSAATAYEKQTNKKFAKNGWPVFTRSIPCHADSFDLSAQNEADLITMLEYSLEMNSQLKRSSAEALGFRPLTGNTGTAIIPKIELADGIYRINPLILPEPAQPEFPPVILENEDLFHALAKLPKRGTLLCQLGEIFSTSLISEQGTMPAMIFAVKRGSDAVFCDQKAYDYEDHPEHLLAQFLQKLKKEKYLPKKFIARNARTAAFLQDAAQKLGCELEIREDLPKLDDAADLYYFENEVPDFNDFSDDTAVPDDFSTADALDALEMIATMPQSFFTSLPQQAQDTMRGILNLHILPEDLQEKLEERLGDSPKKVSAAATKKNGGKKDRSKKKTESNLSYVISVSPYTGCYRHIRVPANIRLSDLASVILHVFGFDEDHLYSFFMDNRVWSDNFEFASSPDSEWNDARPANHYTLKETLIRDDGKFLFLFDYGDAWRFSCRVLREIPEPTKGYAVVRSKGDAPQQYPDWDDDDFTE